MPVPRPKRRANKPPANSPAPTGRKTSAQGKAHRAAALGPRPTKNPSPERATQNADATGLPPGWIKTTLGEICERVATIQPEADPDTEFTYFDIGGIDNETNRVVETKTVLGREAPSRARQAVRRGDILFSTVRTYLKKIAQIDKDYPNPVASTGFIVLRAPEGVSPQFLFRQVLSDDFLKPVHDLQSGSSYPAVRDKDVFAQPIKLAPTAEQDRIVAKLDAMLSRIAAGEAAAQRALKRLDSYRATVLHAAVTGELTREWREAHKPEETGAELLERLLVERRARWTEAELKRLIATGKQTKDDKWENRYPDPTKADASELPPLPKGWIWASIDQLTVLITSGSRGWKSYYSKDGAIFIRSQDIRTDELDLKDIAHVRPPKNSEGVRTQVRQDDLLVTITDANVGKAAFMKLKLHEAYVSQHVGLIRFVDTKSVRLAHIYITAPADGRKRLLGFAYGAGKPGLNLENLRGLAIPIPPQNEQAEIVREVEQRLASADRLAVTLNHQLAHARAARQSVMSEAFAGRLVPQNPDDAPASEIFPRQSKDSSRAVTRSRSKRPDSPRRRQTEALVSQP
jgi:type I restriction enzyme S subunit